MNNLLLYSSLVIFAFLRRPSNCWITHDSSEISNLVGTIKLEENLFSLIYYPYIRIMKMKSVPYLPRWNAKTTTIQMQLGGCHGYILIELFSFQYQAVAPLAPPHSTRHTRFTGTSTRHTRLTGAASVYSTPHRCCLLPLETLA